MFTPDTTLKFIPATREQVIAVVESSNQSPIQLPGRPTQVVSGYLCGLRHADGSFSVYLGIFLPNNRENVIYVHPERQTTVERYSSIEVEGLHFLESMGFMVTNLNFRNLSVDQQEAILKRIPLFCVAPSSKRLGPEDSALSTQQQDDRARFLASF